MSDRPTRAAKFELWWSLEQTRSPLLTELAHGTLTATAPSLTYMPVANYNGPDSFTFKVEGVWIEAATVTIAVRPVNDASDT